MLKLTNKNIGLLAILDNKLYGVFHLASIRDTLGLREFVCFMIIQRFSNKKKFYIEETTHCQLEKIKDESLMNDLEKFCEFHKVFDAMHVMKAELMWNDLLADKVPINEIKFKG